MAFFAMAVSVRVWLAEGALIAGRSAQRRGDFNAAASAYRAASGRGNADAAISRARLEMLLRDWEEAGECLREAMTLTPTRAVPRILQATLEINRPGEWDGAREERVLAACRAATALEPSRGDIWFDAAGIMLKLAALRHARWDPARASAVTSEAADGFAMALTRDPGAARGFFARVIAAGGDPVFLLTVVSRRDTAVRLADLLDFLLDRALWTGVEAELWAASDALGILPLYVTAATEALARRALVKEGLALARRGLQAAPGDAALRMRFAGFLAARKLFGEAESEARAVVGADPKNAEAWFLLGEIMRSSGRAVEAGAAYREAAGLRPLNAAYRLAAAGEHEIRH